MIHDIIPDQKFYATVPLSSIVICYVTFSGYHITFYTVEKRYQLSPILLSLWALRSHYIQIKIKIFVSATPLLYGSSGTVVPPATCASGNGKIYTMSNRRQSIYFSARGQLHPNIYSMVQLLCSTSTLFGLHMWSLFILCKNIINKSIALGIRYFLFVYKFQQWFFYRQQCFVTLIFIWLFPVFFCISQC
jgi:hypothetical protein